MAERTLVLSAFLFPAIFTGKSTGTCLTVPASRCMIPLNERNNHRYNQETFLQKGIAGMKQAIWSMVAVLLAAGILAGAVLYTVFTMRTVQIQILTGENTVKSENQGL